ncbi:MAG: TnsD family Tn7-like transposition protein, partial [Clostridium sp.]
VNTRVNWEERDNNLLLKVKEIIENWNANEEVRPIQITKTRIASKTLRPHLILKNSDKLQKTLNYISTVVESDETFRFRRIDWAIAKLSEEGEVLSEWKVLRKAAIRSDFINEGIIQHINVKLS